MELIGQRHSETEETRFTREQAEGYLDAHFSRNPALGAVQRKDYQGYFLDLFGVDYHAFGVDVTGSGAGIVWWGAMVTREMVDLSQNRVFHQHVLDSAQRLG